MARRIVGEELVTDANARDFARATVGQYRHMSPHDSAVWSAFLTTHLIDIERVMYDVTLGGRASRHIPDGSDMKQMWETLIKKRVDAVVWTHGQVWCVEVKPLAGMAALGQALAYAFLWNAEGRSETKARAVVVCARVDEDVEAVFLAYGVLVIVVTTSDDGVSRVSAVLGTL